MNKKIPSTNAAYAAAFERTLAGLRNQFEPKNQKLSRTAQSSVALLGAAGLAYVVYNNPAVINTGISLLCRYISSSTTAETLNTLLKGYLKEVVTVTAGYIGYTLCSALVKAYSQPSTR